MVCNFYLINSYMRTCSSVSLCFAGLLFLPNFLISSLITYISPRIAYSFLPKFYSTWLIISSDCFSRVWFVLLPCDSSWIISYSWLNFYCSCFSDCKYVSFIFFSASAILLQYSSSFNFFTFNIVASASLSILFSNSLFYSKMALRYFSNSYYFSAFLTSLIITSSYYKAYSSYFSSCSTSWVSESNLIWFLGAEV